ncbi:rhodanese-like domain-containing protein [Bacillus benzoevorans]|uniref:Rhodanese-related sulfurtransferase n=1 Tax=Bacillus benzoevorans TaxID=1456 RepID=A0A7X0HR30_9BACI|nr:rhodanese-like domain-containing protein [Bacillus benzoevorans]MBB6445339.1 rhodanese-related sulfurtransferase [Bacillus benzoevorans]
MDYINYILLGLIGIFFVMRMLPTRGVRQITAADLKQELTDKNKQFIDVRTPGEFKSRNISGFKNIPLHQLAEKSNGLSKEKEVVVICQSGMRSNKASKILKKQGFKYVTNVKDGMSAWI